MFDILRKSLATGVVTTAYPDAPPAVSANNRGRPEIDFARWRDARPAAAICPTGALSVADKDWHRTVTLDLGQCVFCGLCAEIDAAIRMTPACELAARTRRELITTARYRLRTDGQQEKLVSPPTEPRPSGSAETAQSATHSLIPLARQLQTRIHQTLGRSLHIREVDAGSCNGCEIEIVGLNSPVYDLERFGLHFVASPRHADMLLVTGPVARNMELALRKTYDATPDPRLVVAVGACGCSGGIFGKNYASLGGVDQVIPVDVYIPGCPPNPHALLHGLLTALGRLSPKPA
jgi:Ni,Fe-hydrogenase III small subunit/formate hydrogenlyase subunit 6/NADH:ubiquinone oxidoreductase subunit I